MFNWIVYLDCSSISFLVDLDHQVHLLFFKLQTEQPIKGDWASMCRKDLKEMNIELDLKDIRKMPKESFSQIIKQKISEISLKHLLKKRNSKGKEISYNRLT